MNPRAARESAGVSASWEEPQLSPRARAAGVAAIYGAVASLWILLSDRIVAWLVRDPDLLITVAMIKGWVFVLVTALMLYALVRTFDRRPAEARRARAFGRRRPILLAAFGIAAIVAVALLGQWQAHVRVMKEQLRSVVELQAQRIGDSVADHLGQAELMTEIGHRAGTRTRGAESRGPSLRQATEVLEAYRRHAGVAEALLFDAWGRPVWTSSDAGPAAADGQLPARLAQVLGGRTGPRVLGPVQGAGDNVWVDVVVPWAAAANGATPYVAVLRHDARRWLLPLLDPWHEERHPERLMLLRRPATDGSASADSADGPGPQTMLAATGLEALSGEAVGALGWALAELPPAESLWATGHAGQSVLAYVRDVPGTPWRLVAQVDRAAIFENATQDMVWTAMAGLLLLSLAAGGMLLLRQSQALARNRRERTRQADQLKALDLLGAIASSSADVIFAKDLEGRYIFFNPEAERVAGMPASQVIGKDDHLLFPPAEVAMLRERDQRVIERGQTYVGEEALTTALGPKVHLITVSPLRDASGVTLGVCGVGRDITERRLAERALRDNEALLAQAQRIAGVGHYRLDLRAGRWSGSTLLDEMFGFSPDDERDVAAWTDRVHPADRERMVAYFQDSVLGARGRFDTEYRIVNKRTGAVHWVHGLGRLELDEQGAPLRMIGTIQDITARKLGEESLYKLSRVVEQSPESIVITDLDARIEYVNEAFERSSGYRRDEVLGRNPRFLRGGDRPTEEQALLWPALLQGESWRGTLQTRRKDGSLFTELAVISPIRQADGRTTHYVAVKEDITEKQRLNEELERHRHHLEDLVASRTRELAEARERAEAASRAKSSFLANMSHEIRTPLNAILGLTRLVRRAGLDAPQHQRMDKLEGAAHHLMEVISDILDFSKIEAGHLELDESHFTLGELMDSVGDLVQGQAQAKGLRLVIDDAQLGTRWIRGDEAKLRQALLNFAGNAVKFTATGTVTLRVRGPLPFPDEAGLPLSLRFEVEDTGIGMPPAVVDRVFEAFEQADASTSRRFGGTGLGLSIARGLAEAMGGQAGAYSRVDHGSLFWFTAQVHVGVPDASRRRARAGAGASEAALRQRSRAPRILLAEDHDVNREVARELLQGAGCEVVEARDGAETVLRARQTRPDLILMDMQMPGMDGLEAARALRGLQGWATPMIALTANALAEDRQACLDAGMNDFIVKPVDPDTLLATLLRWLPEEVRELPATVATVPKSAPVRAPSSPVAGDVALDYEGALAMVGGQTALLRRLLQFFLDKHAEDGERLREQAQAGDWPAVQQRVHAMRGAAGHLRLHAVHLRAQTLEVDLRAGKTAQGPTQVEELVRALDEALDAIRRQLATGGDAAVADASAVV